MHSPEISNSMTWLEFRTTNSDVSSIMDCHHGSANVLSSPCMYQDYAVRECECEYDSFDLATIDYRFRFNISRHRSNYTPGKRRGSFGTSLTTLG